jgi:DNA-binding NarL/FixJ family response regulator
MNVLLIDDHTLFREGVVLLLRPLLADLHTMEAGSCEQALALLDQSPPPDLVLIDLGLPGMSGLEGIRLLHARHPGLPVVALSSSDDRTTVLQALDAGAMGFIPKSTGSAVFGAALRLILAKGIYLPPSVFLPGQASPVPAAGTPAAADASAPPGSTTMPPTRRPADLGLSPRQAEVLYLILQGKPTKQICRDLDLAPGTVKSHTSAVLRALNVTTRTQAVVVASQLGLVFAPGTTD